MIRDLATCGFAERTQSVIICGPAGVGRNHVALAICHTACHRGYSVRYMKTARMPGDLPSGRVDGNWD